MLYRKMTDYPSEITIPEGPVGGQHEKITNSLRREIFASETLGVKPGKDVVVTAGSLQNLHALLNEEIDLAIYQAGTANSEFKNRDTNNNFTLSLAEFQSGETGKNTRDAFMGLDKDGDDLLSLNEFKSTSSIAFVANLYSEVTHFIVRRGAGIKQPSDLRGKRVALGMQESGHYAMSRILLEHFGLDETDIDAEHFTYDEIEEGFLNDQLDENEKLDAAFLTMGIQAEIFSKLFAEGKCDLLPIKYAEALTTKNVLLSQYKIPAGLYKFQPEAVPAQDIETVAFRGQLLTRTDMNSDFIHEVTGIVLDKHFARQNNLHELLEGGKNFAQEKPEFSIHPGAKRFYDPEFDVHLIETGEAALSLMVSILIAVFFCLRWLNQQRAKKSGHKLDVYIKKLLNIEKQQIGLDVDSQANDLASLQKLLDELTFLRQEALGVFSVYELNEDRGTDCFIEMCHALSNKINAKLSRQRIDKRFAELTEAIKTQNQQHSDDKIQSEDDAE